MDLVNGHRRKHLAQAVALTATKQPASSVLRISVVCQHFYDSAITEQR